MSMALMVQAMQIKVGNPLRKLVLLKLADNANDKGECWPSFQNIADQCEVSVRSVISHISALEEGGFVSRSKRVTTAGQHSNLYKITIPEKEVSLTKSRGESPAPPYATPAPPYAGDSPPYAGDSPPPYATPAPRISHSFEPVKEPKKKCASDEGAFFWTSKKKKLKGEKLEWFILFWEAFDFKNGRAGAADSWLEIPDLSESLVSEIVEGAKREARARGDTIANKQTPKWAQGWLTERRWENETGQKTGGVESDDRFKRFIAKHQPAGLRQGDAPVGIGVQGQVARGDA